MIGDYSTGPAVIVPARVALILLRGLRIAEVRSDPEVRGRDPQVDAVLASWVEVARLEQLRLLGAECGPSRDATVPMVASSSIMGTRDVASLCDIDERTVRKAAAKGALPGVRCGRGWTFSASDVAHWRAEADR